MARDITSIRAELEKLEEREFDPNNVDAAGIETLRDLCDDLTGYPVEVAAPLLFAFLERFADPTSISATWDLGSPGPVVHTLEKYPDYEKFLLQSILRRPAPLSVWMLNRILNDLSEGQEYESYLRLLQSISERSDLPAGTVADAKEFLEHQRNSKHDGGGADA